MGGTLVAVSSREADSFYGHEGGHEGRDWCLQGGYGPMLRCLEAGAGDIRLNVAVKEVVLEVRREGGKEGGLGKGPPEPSKG